MPVYTHFFNDQENLSIFTTPRLWDNYMSFLSPLKMEIAQKASFQVRIKMLHSIVPLILKKKWNAEKGEEGIQVRTKV